MFYCILYVITDCKSQPVADDMSDFLSQSYFWVNLSVSDPRVSSFTTCSPHPLQQLLPATEQYFLYLNVVLKNVSLTFQPQFDQICLNVPAARGQFSDFALVWIRCFPRWYKRLLEEIIILFSPSFVSEQDESISVQHWPEQPGRQRPHRRVSVGGLAHPGGTDALRPPHPFTWPSNPGTVNTRPLNSHVPVSLYWKQMTSPGLLCDLIVWCFCLTRALTC